MNSWLKKYLLSGKWKLREMCIKTKKTVWKVKDSYKKHKQPGDIYGKEDVHYVVYIYTVKGIYEKDLYTASQLQDFIYSTWDPLGCDVFFNLLQHSIAVRLSLYLLITLTNRIFSFACMCFPQKTGISHGKEKKKTTFT